MACKTEREGLLGLISPGHLVLGSLGELQYFESHHNDECSPEVKLTRLDLEEIEGEGTKMQN